MAFTKKPLKWTALGQEPSELKKSEGFKMDESPAPGHFDFMFRSTYEAIEELQQKAGEVKTINNTLPNTAGNISVTKSTVGLSNVDNTSDVNKPISNATKAELDKKYVKPTAGIPKTDLSSDVQTSLTKAESALQSVTKTDIGLGNVDNTSDVNKPISIAQQAEFNKKANLASPVFTGTPTVPTASEATNSTVAASTAFVNRAVATHQTDNVLHNTYVTCATASATAEKVVTASGFTLVAGARITVNFTNANSALSPTLKINTNVAKSVIQNDGKPFEKILSGVYEFLYNGTSFIVLNSVGGDYSVGDLINLEKLEEVPHEEFWTFSAHSRSVNRVAVDSSGNVYTASSDTTVKKINSSGQLVWTFSGHSGLVWDVAVDSSGNVYTASYDNTVKKINSSGQLVWTFSGHSGSVVGVAVDSFGNVYTASYDRTVKKINSSGQLVWTFSGHIDWVWDVAVDSSGNVYTASHDKTVKKINSSGQLVWTFSGHSDNVVGVAVDSSGNVYTASRDKTVKKINSSGQLVWTFSGHSNFVNDVAVDSSGNVYTASHDKTVKKINSSGQLVWTFSGHSGVVFGVAVDSFGNVYTASDDNTVKKISMYKKLKITGVE